MRLWRLSGQSFEICKKARWVIVLFYIIISYYPERGRFSGYGFAAAAQEGEVHDITHQGNDSGHHGDDTSQNIQNGDQPHDGTDHVVTMPSRVLSTLPTTGILVISKLFSSPMTSPATESTTAEL